FFSLSYRQAHAGRRGALGGATLPRYRLGTGLAQQHAPSRRPYRRRDASGGIAPATASGFAIPRSAGIRSSPCDAGLGRPAPVVWEEIEQQCPARDEFPALVSELAQRLKALQTIEQARVKPSGLSIFIGTAPSRHHEEQQLVRKGHGDNVGSVAFSPDGARLASSSDEWHRALVYSQPDRAPAVFRPSTSDDNIDSPSLRTAYC